MPGILAQWMVGGGGPGGPGRAGLASPLALCSGWPPQGWASHLSALPSLGLEQDLIW